LENHRKSHQAYLWKKCKKISFKFQNTREKKSNQQQTQASRCTNVASLCPNGKGIRTKPPPCKSRSTGANNSKSSSDLGSIQIPIHLSTSYTVFLEIRKTFAHPNPVNIFSQQRFFTAQYEHQIASECTAILTSSNIAPDDFSIFSNTFWAHGRSGFCMIQEFRDETIPGFDHNLSIAFDDQTVVQPERKPARCELNLEHQPQSAIRIFAGCYDPINVPKSILANVLEAGRIERGERTKKRI
jgi:hypothetical protein